MGRNNRPNPFAQTFEELLHFLEKKCKEPLLTYQFKQFAKVVSYAPFHLVLELSAKAPEDFGVFLKKTLERHTHQVWQVEGKVTPDLQTIAQAQRAKEEEEKEAILAHPFIQGLMKAFPGSKIEIEEGE